MSTEIKSYYRKRVMLTSYFFYIQVRLPSMDGRVALVPWADMLNHSCEVHRLLSFVLHLSFKIASVMNVLSFLTELHLHLAGLGGHIFGL